MRRLRFTDHSSLFIFVVALGASSVISDDSTAAKQESSADADVTRPRSRTFQFHYDFDLTGLETGQEVRVWMPAPKSSDHQRVTRLEMELPGPHSFHREPGFGNRILYIESVTSANELRFRVPYRIERHEVLDRRNPGQDGDDHQLSRRERRLFLQSNAKVPIDGRPLELLAGIDLSDDDSQLGRQLYELVDGHVTYRKTGTGWGNGDVLWVCDSGYGNCTDFHSLFISLARSQGLPSRFEIGFPIDPDSPRGEVGGYHCWAFFFTRARGWVPVDISEADKDPSLRDYFFGGLTPDRVTFSTGRDIELVPESTSGPLNYFVYPHVEVNGEPLEREQIVLRFSYEDE